MRRWMLAIGLFGIVASACGDDAPACLLDTDCPLGQRCSMEKCVERGAPVRRDSGTPSGEGGVVADMGVLPDSGLPPPVDMGFPPPFDMGFPLPVDMGFPAFDTGPAGEAGVPDSGMSEAGAMDTGLTP